jgi:hypothetical protein
MNPEMQVLMAAFNDELEKVSMRGLRPGQTISSLLAKKSKSLAGAATGPARGFMRGGGKVMPSGKGRKIGELGSITSAPVADAGKDLSRYAR